MKKILTIELVVVGMLGICFFISKGSSELKGTYISSNQDNNYIVQITVDKESNTFVEYIDQREVDRGTISKNSNSNYTFKSNKQEFEVVLKGNNSFDVLISKINGAEPISLKNSADVNTYFSTNFGDEEKYNNLISSR
nr:hypothetical protein [Clostridium paraputrificum]